MKTKNILKKALTLTSLFFCLLYSSKFNAQIASPYPFINSTGSCSINVSYTIYTSVCATVVVTSQTFPPGTTNITVPAGGVDIDMIVNWLDVSGCTIVSQTPSPNGAAQTACTINQIGTLTWNASNPSCVCASFPSTLKVKANAATAL
jgi:hypothetical protein